MRVLVVSDTHRYGDNFYALVEQLEEIDLVIHCGDIEGQEYEFEEVVQECFQCPFVAVTGNNDFFSNLDQEAAINVGPLRALVTHGHHYYVSMSNEFIKQEAKARGFDMVFYGHTHRPVFEQQDGITVVNPGSLTYPRQEGRRPSYALLEVEPNGKVSGSICYI